MHSSSLKKKLLKEEDPRDLFLSRPGSAPGRIWPKNNNTCKGPWVLHPYQVSSKSIKQFWRRSWKCERLRTMTMTTDGQTDRQTGGRTDDEGRCAMTIAHLSLRLRWAKNGKTNCKKIQVQIWPWFLTYWPQFEKGPSDVMVNTSVKYHYCMPKINGFIMWKRYKV